MQKVIKDVFQDYKKENDIINATIQKIDLYKKSNKLEVELFSQNQLKIEDLADFETYLSTRFNIQTIILDVKYPKIQLSHTLEEDWDKIIKYISVKFPITKAILKGSTIELNQNKAVINLKNKSSEFLYAYSVDGVLERLFMNLYGIKYKITYNENMSEDDMAEQKHLLEEMQDNVCKTMINNIRIFAEEKEVKQEIK